MKKIFGYLLLVIITLFEPVTGLSLGLLVVGLSTRFLRVNQAMGLAFGLGLMLDVVLVRHLGLTSLFLVGVVVLIQIIKMQFGEHFKLIFIASMVVIEWGYQLFWARSVESLNILAVVGGLWLGMFLMERVVTQEGIYLQSNGKYL